MSPFYCEYESVPMTPNSDYSHPGRGAFIAVFPLNHMPYATAMGVALTSPSQSPHVTRAPGLAIQPVAEAKWDDQNFWICEEQGYINFKEAVAYQISGLMREDGHAPLLTTYQRFMTPDHYSTLCGLWEAIGPELWDRRFRALPSHDNGHERTRGRVAQQDEEEELAGPSSSEGFQAHGAVQTPALGVPPPTKTSQSPEPQERQHKEAKRGVSHFWHVPAEEVELAGEREPASAPTPTDDSATATTSTETPNHSTLNNNDQAGEHPHQPTVEQDKQETDREGVTPLIDDISRRVLLLSADEAEQAEEAWIDHGDEWYDKSGLFH
jgi:hypothetical protein